MLKQNCDRDGPTNKRANGQTDWHKFSNIDFREHIYKIYPRELEIKPESNNPKEVAFLDLKIKINNSQLTFSIYDKRDDFNFAIVNFPYMDSCIPKKSALGVFYSQLIRYFRLNSSFVNFKLKCKQLASKLISQGYLKKDLMRISTRFFNDNRDIFSKFNIGNLSHFMKEIWWRFCNWGLSGSIGFSSQLQNWVGYRFFISC